MTAVALSVAGCAFMWDSPDLDNPLDSSVWTFENTDPRVEARSLLLKKVTPKSTSIDEARAYLESLGTRCQRETGLNSGYLCTRERTFAWAVLLPIDIVRQARHCIFRIHLIERAGKLDDISVEIEVDRVEY